MNSNIMTIRSRFSTKESIDREWVAVDGGADRACRGKSAGDNLASYFTVNSVGSPRKDGPMWGWMDFSLWGALCTCHTFMCTHSIGQFFQKGPPFPGCWRDSRFSAAEA